jgi:short-subunit dehydrogenase
MSLDWQQQTIVITGAYGGLGQALSKKLSAMGANLIITGRNAGKLERLKQDLDPATLTLVGEVSSEAFRLSLLKLLDSVKTSGHILINNAGISDAQMLSQQDEIKIKQMIIVNLMAPILLCKSLLPWLESADSAKIINIGSTFGAIGYPGFSGYCATKFGLRGFSQALNRELADTNVLVQYLAPRAIATAINSDEVNVLNQKLKNNVDTVDEILPQIIKAIEKRRSEQFFGWPEKLFAKINGLFPKIVASSINKELKTIKQTFKKH